jgi:membrane dipeptidase
MRKFLLMLCWPLMGQAQQYLLLHQQAIVVDTHNDIPSTAIEKKVSFDQQTAGNTHSDLNRMLQGGIDAQVFSIWCDGQQANPYQWANREIDTVMAWTNRNPQKMMPAFTTEAIRAAARQKKLAVLFGVEGGHMIENDLDKLTALYQRGVRYMTITWNNSTDWATSALTETSPNSKELAEFANGRQKGLSDFGKSVIKKMNELGMLVDLSHVGEKTFWDAIQTTTKPVLVSHSCVYAICNHRRNLKDDQIKAVSKNGGVIHLNFYSGFLDSSYEKRTQLFNRTHQAERDSLLKLNPEPYFADKYLFEKYPNEVVAMRPPLSLLIDHIDYIVKLIGIDHVGLGSDFDGVNSLPQQLDDVTAMPLITKALMEKGYSKQDIRKILGENFLRLLKANENR